MHGTARERTIHHACVAGGRAARAIAEVCTFSGVRPRFGIDLWRLCSCRMQDEKERIFLLASCDLQVASLKHGAWKIAKRGKACTRILPMRGLGAEARRSGALGSSLATQISLFRVEPDFID